MNIRQEAHIWDYETHDGYGIRFQWNLSHTVNIFTGIDDDGELTDLVEVDVMSIYPPAGNRPTLDEVREAVRDYVADYGKEYM